MNKFVFMGRLGADPEVKFSTGGWALAKVRIAVDHRKKVEEKWEKDTNWFSIDFTGDTAETLGKYYKKGRQILIEGEIHPWQAEKDGEKKYGTNFVGRKFWFLDSREAYDSPGEVDRSRAAPPPPQTPSLLSEDEIPF
jgi:single-strand DNA-binding protein